MTAHEIFLSIWKAGKTIEFDTTWHNSTGYLNGAARVPTEEVMSFTDDADRRGILIPWAKGSLVVFERYSGGDKGILVSNAHTEMRVFFTNLSVADMELVASLVHSKSYTAAHLKACCAGCGKQEDVKASEMAAVLAECGFARIGQEEEVMKTTVSRRCPSLGCDHVEYDRLPGETVTCPSCGDAELQEY